MVKNDEKLNILYPFYANLLRGLPNLLNIIYMVIICICSEFNNKELTWNSKK